MNVKSLDNSNKHQATFKVLDGLIKPTYIRSFSNLVSKLVQSTKRFSHQPVKLALLPLFSHEPMIEPIEDTFTPSALIVIYQIHNNQVTILSKWLPEHELQNKLLMTISNIADLAFDEILIDSHSPLIDEHFSYDITPG
ncbi:hypothetical protein CWB96_00360 [Pseudoalteromonas citrea]|uniref:Uncharacterized protein n=2 Tax=Pseudoalteromonas citrea TaxID=43655 RepID=A0A5S3XX49_9GAMM|nr:hypothetical protein CWB97_02355 [Pseudoalteromonas citrea]TMP63095.1 hypothetical protein CWB96_00360 [Pseudoalteromonas citrea]